MSEQPPDADLTRLVRQVMELVNRIAAIKDCDEDRTACESDSGPYCQTHPFYFRLAEEVALARELQPKVATLARLTVERQEPTPQVAPEDHLDIYVPGVQRCLKCEFELTSATLFMQSGDVGQTRAQALCEEPDLCPNDGEPMVKVRWRERAAQNYEAYGALMNEIIGIAGLSVQCESLPAALATLREAMGRHPGRTDV